MQAITTVGLDIAKSVFQVHGVDADGQVVLRRQLKRRYVVAFFEKLAPCLVGIEACAFQISSTEDAKRRTLFCTDLTWNCWIVSFRGEIDPIQRSFSASSRNSSGTNRDGPNQLSRIRPHPTRNDRGSGQ